MASDSITSFIIYPAIPPTDAARGAWRCGAWTFRSRDGADLGRREHRISFWSYLRRRRQHDLIYLFGSTAKEPTSNASIPRTRGRIYSEVVRDVVPTDLVVAPVSWRQQGVTYLATSDSGLYRIDNGSVFGLAYDVSKLPTRRGWMGQRRRDWDLPPKPLIFICTIDQAGLVVPIKNSPINRSKPKISVRA